MLEHAESYLRAILGFIGIADPQFIVAEGVALGDEPREAALASAFDSIRAIDHGGAGLIAVIENKLSREIHAKEQTTLRSLVSRVEIDAHQLRIHLSSDCLLAELGVVTEAGPQRILPSPRR